MQRLKVFTQLWTAGGSDDPNKCFRFLCKCHRLYGNCVRRERHKKKEKKTCKHDGLRGNGQSEGFFAMVMNRRRYKRARTKAHFILSTDLWSGLPYLWGMVAAVGATGGSGYHNARTLSLSLSSQVCYRCLWLCCKIACSKYELIPLQWNAPNPNKRPRSERRRPFSSSNGQALFTWREQKNNKKSRRALWIFTTK